MSTRSDTAVDRCVPEISHRMMTKLAETDLPREGGQLRQVAGELCRSVCEAAALRADSGYFDDRLMEGFICGQSERIGEVLSAIRGAFHNWVFKDGDGKDVALFDMPVAMANEMAKRLTDANKKDVIAAYGTVWMHVRALGEIRRDSKSEIMRGKFLNATTDRVEYVASLYLAGSDFVSPLLEWAIVDALVLDRIKDFAALCASTGNLPETPDGQVISGPLLPGSGSRQMGAKLPAAVIHFGAPALELGLELIALSVTWVVCEFLAGSEGIAKWILFSGVTVGRWVTNAVKANGPRRREDEEKGETNLQMLWDMGAAHEKVPAMNVELLKHLLYRLEERNAGFSPAIFGILDRKARREAAI